VNAAAFTMLSAAPRGVTPYTRARSFIRYGAPSTEGVKPGDRIDITYTQALLTNIQPAK